MHREKIASLISEHKFTYESQALAFLLYFFSILYELIDKEWVEQVDNSAVSMGQLAQMLHEDFIDNDKFKKLCLHSDNEDIHLIYSELVKLVTLFISFGDNRRSETKSEIDAQIAKIHSMLKIAMDAYTL